MLGFHFPPFFPMDLNLGLSGECFLKPKCFSCSPGRPLPAPPGLVWSASPVNRCLAGPPAAFDAHPSPDFNVAVCTAPLISYFRGKPW